MEVADKVDEVVEGRIADIGPDFVAALDPEEGPGLRVGPSLALNLETGPRIGPNPGTVLNPNQDLVQNPETVRN